MRCDYLPQDWATRMDGGVAFYNGEPVIIGANSAKIIIHTFPDSVAIKSIKSDDELLDLSSPKLGYVNLLDASVYVYRKPERKYKQTLTWGSCATFDPSGINQRHSIDTLFHSTAFKDMLMNKYPKLDSVIKSLTEKVSKVKSRAISRNVCLSVDSFGIIRVFYKMDEVGYIKPGENTVRVPKGQMAWVVSKYLENYNWVID